MHKSSKTLPSL